MSSVSGPVNILERYPIGHDRVFDEPLQFCQPPLAIGGSGHAYVATSKMKNYFVKMYRPYDERAMEWDRMLLLKKGICVLDADLDRFFNPWHRESRAYEHMDDHIEGPARAYFPEYYGTAKLPYSSCPDAWRQAFQDHGEVCIIVLELLDNPRSGYILPELKMSEFFLSRAKHIYSRSKDYEYTHIFVHLCEIADILHQVRIIHSDITPDNLIDYSVTKSSVLVDFSRSWVSMDGLPCLDPFKKEPKTFEERRDSELNGIGNLVLLESTGCDSKRYLREKFPSLADCQRCKSVMKEIIS